MLLGVRMFHIDNVYIIFSSLPKITEGENLTFFSRNLRKFHYKNNCVVMYVFSVDYEVKQVETWQEIFWLKIILIKNYYYYYIYYHTTYHHHQKLSCTSYLIFLILFYAVSLFHKLHNNACTRWVFYHVTYSNFSFFK